VSVYVPEKIVDGKGNVYHAAIEHVALVTNPVVSGQGPFIPIAASRKRYNRGKPMDWKKVAEALGLDPASLTEENAEAAILEAIAGMSGKAKDYPEMESRAKKAEAALEASRKNAPADGRPLIDEDALEMAATAACNGFRGLVKEGKITPAAEKRLVAALVGEPNRRIECGLSPKAAKHAGLAGPLANTIIGILEENAPMPLGGSKTLAASRANVDDAQQRAEEIIKRIRRESGQPV
jgi:hypothetical protein